MGIYKQFQRLFQMGRAFRKGTTVLPYFPSRIWIELTDHCNLKCPLCPNQDLLPETKGFISPKLFQNILDQVRGRVHDLYLFHRGESLLHPRAVELIQSAQNLGIPCRLHTNATLLSPALSGRILDSGLEMLSFSFDGYLPAHYEINRYPAKFEATLEKIKTFLNLKIKSGQRKPLTVLQIMGAGENRSDPVLKNFLTPLKSLGLDRVVFRQPHNWGGAVPSLPGENETGEGPLFACTFPWYALVIFWTGQVSPCPQDFFGRLEVGDLGKKSIEEIWNGPEMQSLRERISQKAYSDLRPCRECDRPRRKTLAGVPREYFRTFLKENMRR
ncbi:MAG: SPASM domain-containing protein [Thermodesulfobacteriota bacterium]